MKRKIEIILLCLIVLTIGCQKEELYSDRQESVTESTNLQLLKSGDLIVNDIMGSKTKSVVLNSKVDYEYPWLLDLEDNKDRLVYCMESEDNFTDRKMIYVKDGDKRFNYIVERAYVCSNVDNIEKLDVDSKVNFTGILTIYTSENKALCSYFYVNNEFVGETMIDESSKSLKSRLKNGEGLAHDEGKFPNLLPEVKVFGDGSVRMDLWFLQNSGRYTNYNRGRSSDRTYYPSDDSYDEGGSTNNSSNSSSISNNSERIDPEKLPKDKKAFVELMYLEKRGDKELAKVLRALLNDPHITTEDKVAVYVAIHEAYLKLQGEYMMAIFSPENLGTVLSLALIPNITTTTQNKIFNLALTAKDKSFVRMITGIRDALKGKGNFGLGRATRNEAMAMGKAWVGEGYEVKSIGNQLIWKSKNGMRQFRLAFKSKLGKTQANFQRTNGTTKSFEHNGHLDLTN